MDLPGGLDGKASAYNGTRPGFNRWVVEDLLRQNGNPLHICFRNPWTRDPVVATVHGSRKEPDATEQLYYLSLISNNEYQLVDNIAQRRHNQTLCVSWRVRQHNTDEVFCHKMNPNLIQSV